MKKIIIVSIILILGIVNYTDSSDTNYTDFKFNKTGGRPDGATFAIISYKEPQNHLPINKDKPYKEYEFTIFAYTATKGETDDTPCVTASGVDACNDSRSIIACNSITFGRAIHTSRGLYQVFDRMNSRYKFGTCDILMKTKKEALAFGKQRLLVKIYK